jgi:hypothetical protein
MPLMIIRPRWSFFFKIEYYVSKNKVTCIGHRVKNIIQLVLKYNYVCSQNPNMTNIGYAIIISMKTNIFKNITCV